MSVIKIYKALENHLQAISSGISTVYQNDDFTPSLANPYQRVDHIPNDPDNSEMGAANYIERGLLQVTLAYPSGKGAGAAELRSEQIRSHFKRGVTLTHDGQVVHVIRTPKVAPALLDQGRYMLPITVTWTSRVTVP